MILLALPTLEARGSHLETYRLKPQDTITVETIIDPHLTRRSGLLIRPDGMITIRGIGDVLAAGCTPEGLARRIEEKYLEAKIFSGKVTRDLSKLPRVLTVTVERIAQQSVLSKPLGQVYRLNPFDTIGIECSLDPPFTRSGQLIRPDGMITIPGIGDFLAAGRTPEELGQRILKAFVEQKRFSGELSRGNLENSRLVTVTVERVAQQSVLSKPLGQVYRFKPLDTVNVEFLRDPTLSSSNLPIRPNGRITVPGIGEVLAAGSTPEELGAQIERRCLESRIFERGGISANIKEQPSVIVSVASVYPRSILAWVMDDPHYLTMKEFYYQNYKKKWFWPTIALTGCFFSYLLGIIALLALSWRFGSMVFSKTWLRTLASKPLMVIPGLARWALFLGYRRRLSRLRPIEQASKLYFGLPAKDPEGLDIQPDLEGENLHKRISEVLGPQQPVILVGSGGAGKSTVLARWAFLALKAALPKALTGYRPILITAPYYSGNLVKAAADVLKARDGVAVEEESMRAQLQSGKFLILFDGITEVDEEKPKALSEILKTAGSAEFSRCRFLISTRPSSTIAEEVSTFHLHSLELAQITEILPHYRLNREQEHNIMAQIKSFGNRAIAPLLFKMIIARSDQQLTITTRCSLYESYFLGLLHTEKNSLYWLGWREVMECLADMFLVRTGQRGIGLHYAKMVKNLDEQPEDGSKGESPVARVKRLYPLPVESGAGLAQQLHAAGILEAGRRWRFSHDTFEEYFAAGSVFSYVDEEGHWPDLIKWVGISEREKDFLGVIEFVRDMSEDQPIQHILNCELPECWKECLTQKPRE